MKQTKSCCFVSSFRFVDPCFCSAHHFSALNPEKDAAKLYSPYTSGFRSTVQLGGGVAVSSVSLFMITLDLPLPLAHAAAPLADNLTVPVPAVTSASHSTST